MCLVYFFSVRVLHREATTWLREAGGAPKPPPGLACMVGGWGDQAKSTQKLAVCVSLFTGTVPVLHDGWTRLEAGRMLGYIHYVTSMCLLLLTGTKTLEFLS